MNILIKSHFEAESFLRMNRGKWDVICILNAGSVMSKSLAEDSKSFPLRLVFDDIDCNVGNYVPPSIVDVRNALNFCHNKPKILVTCFNGITRSAAIGYVIMCKEFGPKKAIESMKDYFHPNKLIIEHAAKLLNNKRIKDEFDSWKSPYVLQTD